MFPIFQKISLALKKLLKKRGVVLVIFILCGTLVLAPTASVQAGVLSSILNTIGVGLLGPGATLTLSVILHFFLGLGYAIMCLLSELLEWALGNPFTYSLTNPGGNSVINIGWTVLRDLTNMLFVLGLAYIGLATALNIGGFNTKKTFGRLIVAALMINFTPVICGVIVDAANILMKFFTVEVGNNFNAFTTMYADKGGWVGVVQEVARNSFTTAGLIKVFSSFVYTGLVSGILFIFVFLLLARNIAIWLLVIFSPIAFFCWIFDSTKKHFQRWWKEFLNWSFIGVFVGFVLYLSGHLLQAFKAGGLTNTTTIFSADFNVFTQLMPNLIICLFMGFAYIQVLKVSAAGSQGAVQAAQFVGGKIKSGSKKLGQYGLTKARNAALKAEEKRGFGTGSKLGKGLRWLSGRGTPDEEKDWGSNLLKKTMRAWVGGTGLPGMAIRYGLSKASEVKTREAEEAAKKAGGSMESQEEALKRAMALAQYNSAIGILNRMMKDGNYKFSDYAKGQLSKVMTNAVKNNPLEVLSNMRFMDPLLSEQLAKELKGKVSEANLQKAGLWMNKDDMRNERYMTTDEKGEAYASLAKKLFSIAKPAVIENWSRETAEKYIKDFAHEVGTGTHIQKIGEVFGRDLVDQFIEGIKTPEEYIKNGNTALGRWILSGSAANMGISYDDNDAAREAFKEYSKTPALRQAEIAKLQAQMAQAKTAKDNKITLRRTIETKKAALIVSKGLTDPEVLALDVQIADVSDKIDDLTEQYNEADKKISQVTIKGQEMSALKKEAEAKVSDVEAQTSMTHYRTEKQLEREAQKEEYTAQLETQKAAETVTKFSDKTPKTGEELQRLSDKYKKAVEPSGKIEKAETEAEFYTEASEMAKQEREEKETEALGLGLRKYPETTIKKEEKKEKKLTARARKELRKRNNP